MIVTSCYFLSKYMHTHKHARIYKYTCTHIAVIVVAKIYFRKRQIAFLYANNNNKSRRNTKDRFSYYEHTHWIIYVHMQHMLV